MSAHVADGQPELAETAHEQQFARNGYAMLRALVPTATTSFLADYVMKAERAGQLKRGDAQAPNARRAYSDPLMEALLEVLLPKIEAASAKTLAPTYSYLRVYRRGAELERHTDRPSCEVSVSLALDIQAPRAWPIFIEAHGTVRQIELSPGDALVYRGIDLPHGREAFDGDHAIQVFLHYVDRNGPYRDWAFDRRKTLGCTSSTRLLLDLVLREKESGGTV